MSDIFLSYAREDQDTARMFADGLEAAGFSVWWDVTLRSGEAYDAVTELALKEAKAVVVLWSRWSVGSRWVRAEAAHGDRHKILAPAMIEPCERPIMFELTQSAELFDWKGDLHDPVWLEFLDDLNKIIATGRAASAAAAPPEAATARPTRRLRLDRMAQVWPWALVVAIAAVALVVSLQSSRHNNAATAVAGALELKRTAKCSALLDQNVSVQARSIAFIEGDLPARLSTLRTQIHSGRSGSDIYYPAIEETTTSIGDYPYLSHYWEEFSSCVNDATLQFDAVAKDIPFPESFWNRTRDLRHEFGHNWRGEGQELPDFMSNFAELCMKYRADRSRRSPRDVALNCEL